MKIIGITGQARSGKDTVADIIESSTVSAKFAFADPIKDMLFFGLGVDINDSKDNSEFCGVSHRKLMQSLGTEWGRNMVSNDIWIEVVKQKLESYRFHSEGNGLAIITDVRFANEAEWVREHGTLIHIIGRGGIPGDHSSEDGVPVVSGDITIQNYGTIEELKGNTLLAVTSCLSKYRV